MAHLALSNSGIDPKFIVYNGGLGQCYFMLTTVKHLPSKVQEIYEVDDSTYRDWLFFVLDLKELSKDKRLKKQAVT